MIELVQPFVPFAQIALDALLLGIVAYFFARDRAAGRRMREETARLQELAASLRRLREEGEAATGEIAKAVDERGAELKKLLKDSERKRSELLTLFEAVESKKLQGVTAPQPAAAAGSADLYMRAAKLLLGGESASHVADAMGISEREAGLIRELQGRIGAEASRK